MKFRNSFIPAVVGLLSLTAHSFAAGSLSIDFEAQNLSLAGGLYLSDAAYFGLEIAYLDDENGISQIRLTANRPSSEWLFERETGSGTTPIMKLESEHTLTLYSSYNPYTPAIKLDAENGVITVNGYPLMIDTGTGFLTGGSFTTGGSTASGENATALGWSTAEGDFASAIGNNSEASAYAIALGHYNTADGYAATAVGSLSTAKNYYATALGNSAHATGASSLALGSSSSATNEYSMTLGVYCFADGYASTAMGVGTISSGYMQFVIGRYNEVQGDPLTLFDTDALFIIGNGSSDTDRRNAFVVLNNGDTTVDGNLSVKGAMLVRRGGDLSMGPFQGGPVP